MSELVAMFQLLVACVVFAVDLVAHSATFLPESDGWHSWEVPAGAQGARACCYNFRNDVMGERTGCRLGPGSDGVTLNDDCEPLSDTLRVYVFRDGGKVREIRALSAACPVETKSAIKAKGAMDAEASIAWLVQQAQSGTSIAEDAVTALAMHADEVALPALQSLIEDRSQERDLREEALFWLAQSDSDEAYRYLDGLLSQR